MMGRATPTERHKVWLEWLDHLSHFHNLEFSSDELRIAKLTQRKILGNAFRLLSKFFELGHGR